MTDNTTAIVALATAIAQEVSALAPPADQNYVQLSIQIITLLAVGGAWIYTHFNFAALKGRSCLGCVSVEPPTTPAIPSNPVLTSVDNHTAPK